MRQCLTCSKEFKPWTRKTKFCSIFCFFEHKRKKERIDNLKQCGCCGEIKPLSDFYKRTDSKQHKGYRGHCKKCEIKKASIYIVENRDIVRKQSHRRMKTPLGQFNKYKTQARRFNKHFELSVEYFEKNQHKPCFYCGSPITKALTMGVDRIDSKIGYIEKNCVPCCMQCNLSKFTYSVEDFINHAHKISDYQRRNNG